MGAGASSAVENAEDEMTGDAVQISSKVAEAANDLADAASHVEIDALVDMVPIDSAKDKALQLITSVPLNKEQLVKAASVFEPVMNESAILASLGGALAQCGDMAPDVVDAVGRALCVVGAHLGPISIAAGFLGAMVYTFQLSKDQDKNVATVTLWSSSVKDWLLMVAERVERSAAESTLPLFEGLKNEMESMFNHIQKQSKRWRITKMLSSTAFQRDFERAKTSVIELKTALKDFLDQEATDAQELKLKCIADAQVDVTTKLETMDDQLNEIRSLLLAKKDTEDTDAAAAVKTTVADEEEEQIYAQMQAVAGVQDQDAPVKFKDFVAAFECLFFAGNDMDAETKRGLRIAIDRECKGKVRKLDWIKFFKQWKASNMLMEDYVSVSFALNLTVGNSPRPPFSSSQVAKLAADAPPTLCAQIVTTGAETGAKVAKHLSAAAATAMASSDQIKIGSLFGGRKSTGG